MVVLGYSMVVLAFCLEIFLFHVYNLRTHLWKRLLDEAISQWEEKVDSKENSEEQVDDKENSVSVEMTEKAQEIFAFLWFSKY